jgi:uncharacterized protein
MVAVSSNAQGSVVALWRYPVKSMMGEELNASDITERGLLGDRTYALVDAETGKVVSAKNPRKWGNMFDFRSAFVDPPHDPRSLPPARITLPDGAQVSTGQADVDRRLSEAVGKPVRLASSVPDAPRLEGYWPEHEWLERPDETFEVAMPPGTFFDLGTIHLLTTLTIDRLRALAPKSRFEIRRFRPNLVVAVPDGVEGFVENDWVGKTLAIGDAVRIHIARPCPRCVMTTLSQGDLPKDPGVLRAAVQNNEGNVGVYASVIQGGHVRRGDPIRFL